MFNKPPTPENPSLGPVPYPKKLSMNASEVERERARMGIAGLMG